MPVAVISFRAIWNSIYFNFTFDCTLVLLFFFMWCRLLMQSMKNIVVL
jgi:hypothetical protein